MLFFPLARVLCALWPQQPVQWGGEETRFKPLRICLQARGPVLEILLTLWFQRYFRKKRRLQRNILKKYEPVALYLSVSILI